MEEPREDDDSALESSTEGGAWGLVRSHPVIVGALVACTLIGAVLGVNLLTEEWSLARRLLGGAVGGLATGFVMTATKMF